MAGKNVLEFTSDNWDTEVVNSDKPVIVDFWAPWCGPCRALNPTIHALARDYKVCQVNIDNNPGLAGRYRVNAVPTLLVFRGGQEVRRIEGALPEAQLRAALDATGRA
jgi:thioredoxin